MFEDTRLKNLLAGFAFRSFPAVLNRILRGWRIFNITSVDQNEPNGHFRFKMAYILVSDNTVLSDDLFGQTASIVSYKWFNEPSQLLIEVEYFY